MTWVSADGANEGIPRALLPEKVPPDGDCCRGIQLEKDREVDHAKEDSEDEDVRSDLLATKDEEGGDQATGDDENQKDACRDAGTTRVRIENIHFEGSIWVKSEDGRGGHTVSWDARMATLGAEEDSVVQGSRRVPVEVDGAQDCRDTQNDCRVEKDESLDKN